jgi:hypothetical protein
LLRGRGALPLNDANGRQRRACVSKQEA